MNLFEELLGREETAVGTLTRNALSILYCDLASRLCAAEDKAHLADYTRTLVETVRGGAVSVLQIRGVGGVHSLGKKYNSAYDYVKRVERIFRAEAEPTTTDVLAADPRPCKR